MNVFKLEVDCAKCDWSGIALVAANDYEAAVSEYVTFGESGDFVASGEIVFTEDCRTPINGLSAAIQKVYCDNIRYAD